MEFAEGLEVNHIPSLVLPFVMALNVLPIMVAVHMESNAFIVLARDRITIDINRALLGRYVIDSSHLTKTSTLAISSGQKVCIHV